MTPTTEPPAQRLFHIMRKNGQVSDVEADTICDVRGDGSYFKFKRGGAVVGEIGGDIEAWWMEEEGQAGKPYIFYLDNETSITILADSKEQEKGGHVTVLNLEGSVVGNIFYAVKGWWIGPTSS